jgi:hypothetical protein
MGLECLIGTAWKNGDNACLWIASWAGLSHGPSGDCAVLVDRRFGWVYRHSLAEFVQACSGLRGTVWLRGDHVH